MNNQALLMIDMQKFFFIENSVLIDTKIIENCRYILSICKRNNIPVLHINTVYRNDQSDWPKSWSGMSPIWCENLVKGKEEAENIEGLTPYPSDIIIEKKRFSAFYNTNLDDVLRSLRIDDLYLIGYSCDVCIRFTAVDAYNRGYKVKIVVEGVESFREPKEQSIGYLCWLINAERIDINEFKKRAMRR